MGSPKDDIAWPAAVFFDFDGVLVDSVQTKSEAFRTLFAEHGATVAQQVVDYHDKYGGLSRFVKFEWAYRALLQQTLSEEKSQALGRKFAQLVVTQVVQAQALPGVERTLEELKARGIPAFIVSGTPESELRYIVEARGMSHFFQGVYGSPKLKPDLLQELLSTLSLDASCCLFVGDAMTDWQAAEATGIPFLGIVQHGAASPFPVGAIISDTVTISPQLFHRC